MRAYKNYFFILVIGIILLYIAMICSAYVNKNMAKIELESEYGDVKLLEDMGLTFNIGDGINNQRIYVRNGQLTRSRVTTYGYEDIDCSYKGEE